MITFKTDKEKQEWESGKLDSRLYIIVCSLSGFVQNKFHKDIEITGIDRSQNEQDNIYKDNPDYQKAKWYSVHQFWRGVDISVKYFTDIEKLAILEFLNQFEYGNDKKTALIHNAGYGTHLHIQTNSSGITVLKIKD